ncbi:gamma-crystallin S-1-like [Cetorhinus maximus]
MVVCFLHCYKVKTNCLKIHYPFSNYVQLNQYKVSKMQCGKAMNLCNKKHKIFYEDRNFQGRHYECSSVCADLSPYFSCCNSIRVDSDCWVVYERPNYMGYQYVLSSGEYPHYQRWMGFSDNIGSCCSYPYFSSNAYRMRIYERPDFGGQMMEFMADCPFVYDLFCYRDIHSCQVMDGYWIFYEHPNYRG